MYIDPLAQKGLEEGGLPSHPSVKALGWIQVSCAEGSTVGSRGVSERDRWTGRALR
jgi:hypothetical protein